jgi:ribulose-bisphosphate carboxylase large chain
VIAHTTVDVSGERFSVIYSVFANEEDAKAIAWNICIEQTIEFPEDLIQDDDIRKHIFGRLENFKSFNKQHHSVTISFAIECSAYTVPQFLNVMYGNISLMPNIRIERFDLPDSLAKSFKGPRFGIEGLRKCFDRPKGATFMSAIKPQGLSNKALAAQAHEFARGELDIVKDDHGLSNQPFSMFHERVERCCDAVNEANAKTGSNCLYTPMISTPSEQIFEDAMFAKEKGAGALLVSPALVGFDVARRLAEWDELGLPIIGHPALIGSYVVSPTNGFSFYALFGQVMRLIGMDASIYPNFGGRFSFAPEECRQIVHGCKDSMSHFKPIWPSPGGGMTFDRIPSMKEFYGEDVMYLMGGNLHKQGMPLADACKKLRGLVEANEP